MIRRLFRGTFSPYEIALWALAIGLALAVLAMVALLRQRTGLALLLFASAPIVGLALDAASSCPRCGKWPRFRAAEGQGWFALYVMGYAFNHWPEKQCSKCGTALDEIPND